MADQTCTDELERHATSSSFRIVVVGGGPVGCLASIFMTKYTKDVTLIEKRGDLRSPTSGTSAGRSINLVLTSRGFYAMQQVGLKEAMQQIVVPVTKRVIHPSTGEANTEEMPYGICPDDCISSISREGMCKLLLDKAEQCGVRILFEHEITAMDLDSMRIDCRTACGTAVSVAADLFIGCDGLGSVTRRAMLAKLRSDPAIVASVVRVEEMCEPAGISYKEITFPSRRAVLRASSCADARGDERQSTKMNSSDGGGDKDQRDDGTVQNTEAVGEYSMDCHALHIWPRETHFLMALANVDNTFTATMFLPNRDAANDTANALPTFEQLEQDRTELIEFVTTYYPDLARYVPDYVEQFRHRTHSALVTLRTTHWHYKHKVVILGDAAHATTPFFGQGVNLGFESALLLDRFLARAGLAEANLVRWSACERNECVQRAFDAFVSYHQVSATAVGELSKANFVELAYRTSLKQFRELWALEKWVERNHGTRFRSRYYIITQTYIPYYVAQMAGVALDRCLMAILQLYKRRLHDAQVGEEEKLPFDKLLTHAEVEDLIDTHVEPFLRQFALNLDNPGENKFYHDVTCALI